MLLRRPPLRRLWNVSHDDSFRLHQTTHTGCVCRGCRPQPNRAKRRVDPLHFQMPARGRPGRLAPTSSVPRARGPAPCGESLRVVRALRPHRVLTTPPSRQLSLSASGWSLAEILRCAQHKVADSEIVRPASDLRRLDSWGRVGLVRRALSRLRRGHGATAAAYWTGPRPYNCRRALTRARPPIRRSRSRQRAEMSELWLGLHWSPLTRCVGASTLG